MQTSLHSDKLVDVRSFINGPATSRLFSMIEYPVEKALALDALNHVYTQIHANNNDDDFFNSCLKLLNISFNVDSADIAKIPKNGPLVVVSNHPFGGLDGIILGAVMTNVRPDVMILGNYLLHHIPRIRSYVIPVDPFQRKGSVSKNLKPIKEILRWLVGGGSLITFPSGEVSHLKIRKAHVADPCWSPHIASFIRRSRATVLPVFFNGRNSAVFNLLGLLHPNIRTALLPRELFNKQASPVSLRIGSPIHYRQLEHFTSDQALSDYLRLSTYILKNRGASKMHSPLPALRPLIRKNRRAPLAAPIPTDRLRAEIDSLTADQVLLRHGSLSVYIAEAHQIPDLMQEIGRLREKSFRVVGEGTGKNRDIDAFDRTYLQLIMWNHANHEIAGGYRIAPVETLLKRFGRQGLYTTTLFKYKDDFFQNLGPALELGRSFVVDNNFSNSIDSLLMVNLNSTPPGLLKRFMGTEGFKTFNQYNPESNRRKD